MLSSLFICCIVIDSHPTIVSLSPLLIGCLTFLFFLISASFYPALHLFALSSIIHVIVCLFSCQLIKLHPVNLCFKLLLSFLLISLSSSMLILTWAIDLLHLGFSAVRGRLLCLKFMWLFLNCLRKSFRCILSEREKKQVACHRG